jgi:hypothetical protein
MQFRSKNVYLNLKSSVNKYFRYSDKALFTTHLIKQHKS